jgi:hypothetical protein
MRGDRRVQVDFEVDFSNGGGLQGQGFRLDIDADDIDDDALADYLVRDLRLLMVATVRIVRKRIIVEPHKRRVSTSAVSRCRACPATPSPRPDCVPSRC